MRMMKHGACIRSTTMRRRETSKQTNPYIPLVPMYKSHGIGPLPPDVQAGEARRGCLDRRGRDGSAREVRDRREAGRRNPALSMGQAGDSDRPRCVPPSAKSAPSCRPTRVFLIFFCCVAVNHKIMIYYFQTLRPIVEWHWCSRGCRNQKQGVTK